MANALKDLSYYNEMALNTQADRTVALAIQHTLHTACNEGDPQALMPEIVDRIAKRTPGLT
jgi:hypothetical protein